MSALLTDLIKITLIFITDITVSTPASFAIVAI